MRFLDIINKKNRKRVVSLTAGVLVIAVLGSTVTALAVNTKESKTEKNVEQQEEKRTDLISFEECEIGKEENVYLLTDVSGQVYETIVTNHLMNPEMKKELYDVTTLSDIENVKGEESFQQDGKKLTWQANGEDIFYRGNTSQEAPVSMKVTYYLDGREVSGKELAGKSGKVTMRFDYSNHSSYEESVNGEKISVKVPFVAMTAVVLGNQFSHVEVTNGKLQSNGEQSVVIGYALPGLKESLGIKDSDFIKECKVPEYFEITADVDDFSLDMTMTMVINAASMVSVKEGEESSLDQMVEELSDAMEQLKSGSSDLAKGLDTLQSSLVEYQKGMNELNEKSGTLKSGVQSIYSSTTGLNAGIQTLDEALNQAMSKEEKEAAKAQAAKAVEEEFKGGKTKEVADQIYASLRYQRANDQSVEDGALYTALYDGAYSSSAASAVYKEVVRQVLLAAAKQPADSPLSADVVAKAIRDGFAKGAQANDPVSTAMYAISEGMTSEQLAELLYAKSGAKDTLFAKTQATIQMQLAQGRSNEKVKGAVEQSMQNLALQLAGACQQAATQAAQSAAIEGAENAKKTIASQIEAVQENGYSLVTGAKALEAGTKQLNEQVPVLVEGIHSLHEATGKITEGVNQLDEGANQLADGILTLDEDGISKLLDRYQKDLKPLKKRLQVLLDAGNSYQSFTGKEKNTNGSVKFFYKMDAIQTE